MEYSFCETVTAGSRSRWHIRPLTEKGRKLGGGADTLALCGRKVSWDLNTPVTESQFAHCCLTCVDNLLKETKI